MARKSRKTTSPLQINLAFQNEQKQVRTYKAALYVRISVLTKEKIESDTIGNQILLLKNFIQDKDDITLFDVYCDEDMTGTNFERPEFERMIEDMRKGNINCIIVKDLSRFGRNYLEAGNFLEKVFPYFGVRFIAVTDNFDTLDDNGDIIIPVKNVMNQLYAKDISRKICSAMEDMQKSGKYAGSKAPYGYSFDEKDKHSLILNPETAPIVQQIFAMTLKGKTNDEIVNFLNKSNIPSPGRYGYENGQFKHQKYKNSIWYKQTIGRILKDEIYLGWMVGGKFKSQFLKSGEKKSLQVPKEDWIVTKDTHEAIIDIQTFQSVQAILEDRKRVFHSSFGKNDIYGKQESILKGKLICGECGKSMAMKRTIQSGKATFWYMCYIHDHYGAKHCIKKAVNKEALEEIVLTLIKRYMVLFTETEELIRKINSKPVVMKKKLDLDRELHHNKSELEKLKKLKSELYQDFTSHLISEIDFLDLGKDINARISCLIESQKRIDSEIQTFTPKTERRNEWKKLIQQYCDRQVLSKEMVDAFIDNITVFENGNLEVCFCFQDEFETFMQECKDRLKALEGEITVAG